MDDKNIRTVSVPNETYVHLVEQNCRLEVVMNYLRNDKYPSIETIFAILGESPLIKNGGTTDDPDLTVVEL